MRDPGTEPLPMITGDVVELTKMIYAERAAHAAEAAERDKQIETLHAVIAGDFNMKSFRKVCADNARLQKALEAVNIHIHAIRISNKALPNAAAHERYSFTNQADATEVESAIEIVRSALAAPPTAAAQAVEGMRKALEGIKVVISGAAPIDRGIALLHRDREEIARHLDALAAWKEATRA